MTVRLWEMPSNYPNKHIGIYRDPTYPDGGYLQFREGRAIAQKCDLVFDFDQSTLSALRNLDCVWTNILIPLVSEEIGAALLETAYNDVQLLPARLIFIDGETEDFSLVNVTALAHCIDYERSIVKYFEEGTVKGIARLRFRGDCCLEGHNLARLSESKGYILVSEKLYDALIKLKCKGLSFELDKTADPFRA